MFAVLVDPPLGNVPYETERRIAVGNRPELQWVLDCSSRQQPCNADSCAKSFLTMSAMAPMTFSTAARLGGLLLLAQRASGHTEDHSADFLLLCRHLFPEGESPAIRIHDLIVSACSEILTDDGLRVAETALVVAANLPSSYLDASHQKQVGQRVCDPMF